MLGFSFELTERELGSDMSIKDRKMGEQLDRINRIVRMRGGPVERERREHTQTERNALRLSEAGQLWRTSPG